MDEKNSFMMSNNSTTSTGTTQELYKSTQMKLFMSDTERTIEKISEGVTIEQFGEVIQKIKPMEGKQKRIFKLHSIIKQKIVQDSVAELREMVEDEGLDEKFIMLNEMINNNSICDSDEPMTPAWRPPQNVSEHVRSHLVKVKLEQKAKLEQYLQELKESNKNLSDAVQTLQSKTGETENHLKELTDKVMNENCDWKKLLETLNEDKLNLE